MFHQSRRRWGAPLRVAALVVFRLAAFLAAAGLVYVVTAREPAGGSLLLVAAVAFIYVGLILRAAVRDANRPALEPTGGGERRGEEEAHVGPTIWPFAFSLASIGFVLGIVVARWLLFAGAVVFLASTVGWFIDVRRQHAHGNGS
ncbi:MAG TPA: cytochrome c oxidase subunit 4 [Actinomycetota bacterium]